MQRIQKLLRHLILLGLIQEQALAGLPANEDVLCDGQVLHQVQLLVHDADAPVLGILGTVDFDLLTEILDDAIVLGVDAGQNFHQRGFARAVFADQSQNFARPDFQLRVIQCVNAREILLDAVHSQNCLAHSNITLLHNQFHAVGSKKKLPPDTAFKNRFF